MGLFKIDKDKCANDGICAIECPAHIIGITQDGPVPIEGAEEICINCGHCVAICPKGAFALQSLLPEECSNIDNDLMLDVAQVEHFFKSRRSIRRYKDKSIPKELFQKALNIACCAPSGHNKQPVKWLVINNKEEVGKIGAHVIDWMRYSLTNHPENEEMVYIQKLVNEWDSGVDRICRNAPQLVLAYASDEIVSGSADCHIALTYLELALPPFGLGSCWAGLVNNAIGHCPDLDKKLDLPENHSCHGVLMVGFPRFSYARAPKRNLPQLRYYS